MPSPPITSPIILFARVFWMMLGPMLLVALLFSIISTGTGWFTMLNFAYLVVLGLNILSRWLEFRGGHAKTDLGEPATPDDLRRYTVLTLSVGMAAWALANLIGNHLLSH